VPFKRGTLDPAVQSRYQARARRRCG